MCRTACSASAATVSNMNGDCGVDSSEYGIFEWREILRYKVQQGTNQTNAHAMCDAKDLELEIAALSNGMSANHTFMYSRDDRLFVYGNLKNGQAGSGLQDLCSHSSYTPFASRAF